MHTKTIADMQTTRRESVVVFTRTAGNLHPLEMEIIIFQNLSGGMGLAVPKWFISEECPAFLILADKL